MNEIAKVKKEVKLKQWTEMIRLRNESGLTVTDWCKQNGVNLKTYYYRLKRVRQAVCSELEHHDIVPITAAEESETTKENIELSVGNIKSIRLIIAHPFQYTNQTKLETAFLVLKLKLCKRINQPK